MIDYLAAETIEAIKQAGATDAEVTKAILLTNDARSAMLALKHESSLANRRNLADAETVQREYVGELLRKYGLDESAATEPDDIFPNRLAVWEYLRDSGWQIGRSRFYGHCAEGRLLRQKDGTYLRKDADRYAKLHCRLLATGEKVNDTLTRLTEDKAKTELAREKIRLEREAFDLGVRKRNFVARADVELMIVGRAVALLSHLQAMVQMHAEDWIVLVGGDPLRARELIDAIQQGLERHLGTFARDIEFEVLLEKNIENEPEQPEQEPAS